MSNDLIGTTDIAATLENAARMALEALQMCANGEDDVLLTRDALSALRQALENNESAYQRGYLDGMAKPCIDCADRKLQAFKQPKQEQEPVAWISKQSLAEVKDFDATVYGRGGFDDATPLYTEPPKRKWVGLTDEEIQQGLKETWVTEQAWQSAVWWAEQKLKEKNT